METCRYWVLAKVSAGSDYSITDLVRRPIRKKAGEKTATSLRNLAVYLCEKDFRSHSTEVQKIFSFEHYASLSHLCKKFEDELEEDEITQKRIEEIRDSYTLAFYDYKLQELRKRQNRLFPAQIKEAQVIVEEMKGKLLKFISTVSSIQGPPRSQEVFNLKYGFSNNSFVPQSLEWVGERYDITRERVRQIITPIWDALANRADVPFNTPMLLEEALEEYRSWQALLGQTPEQKQITLEAPIKEAPVENISPVVKDALSVEQILNAIETAKVTPKDNLLYYLLITDLKLRASAIAERFGKKESDVYKAVLETASLIKDRPEVRKELASIRALYA